MRCFHCKKEIQENPIVVLYFPHSIIFPKKVELCSFFCYKDFMDYWTKKIISEVANLVGNAYKLEKGVKNEKL